MGYIIGITGAIGSGKSTFTNLLAELEPQVARYESGEVIAELAEDFNRALSGELAFETTHNNVELINQSLIWFIEAISEKLHYEVNWNQLALTNHLMAAHPELCDKIFHYVALAKKQPDVLDARIVGANKETYRPLLQWLGAYLVARLRPTIWYDEIFRRIDLHDWDKNLIVINGLRYPSDAQVVRNHSGLIVAIDRPQQEKDLNDPTEASRSQIKPDVTIRNNSSLDQLQAVAEQFWEDLGADKLQKTYSS